LDKQHGLRQFLAPNPVAEFMASLFEIHRSEVHFPHARLVPCNADSFRADLHPDLKADFVPSRKELATATRASAKTILAKPNRRSVSETELHPPFNTSDWGGEHLRQDARWNYGAMPQIRS
jgi:hypothetical protein